MAIHFDQSGFDFAPEQIDTLQRIFVRICFEAGIPRQDVRAARLAKFLTECGRWLFKRASSKQRQVSVDQHALRQTRH